MAQNYVELRSTSTDELVRTYDSLAHNTSLGLGFYRDEIARQAMQLKKQRRLSK